MPCSNCYHYGYKDIADNHMNLYTRPSVKHFYFIRHGSTIYNQERRIQGQCDKSSLSGIKDLPLSDLGTAEANRAAKALTDRSINLDLILSSPLKRAKQTGEIIAQALNLDLEIDAGLKEMFFGAKYEGMKLEEFKKLIFAPPHQVASKANESLIMHSGTDVRELHKKVEPEYDLVCHPGGETKAEVRERAMKTLVSLIADSSAGSILIPTHNALLRFVLSPIDSTQAQIKVANGEIVHVSVDMATNKWKFIERFLD